MLELCETADLYTFNANYISHAFPSTPAGHAAVNAIRQFYDQLSRLPLDEKTPELFCHSLINDSTLERVGNSAAGFIRREKNMFILLDVIETVQRNPNLLNVFCSLLQDAHIAEKLAQLFKGMFC